MARKSYNSRDWYWTVGGSTTQVYSSAVGNFVSVNDAAFVAWKADGTKPTKIDTEENLGEVLAEPNQTRPIPAQVLDGYQTKMSDEMSRVFQMLLATNMMNMENRIRFLERAAGIQPPPPDLTNAQIKQFIKSKI